MFGAHDDYRIDGDSLNNLAILALRLDSNEEFTPEERMAWGDILRYLLADAQRDGVLE